MAAVICKFIVGQGDLAPLLSHLGRKFESLPFINPLFVWLVVDGFGGKACHQNTDQSVISAFVAQVQEYVVLLML